VTRLRYRAARARNAADLLQNLPRSTDTGGRKLPKLAPKQVRCPVCLNGANFSRPNSGKLRYHVDLRGYPCPNRIPPGVEHVHLEDYEPAPDEPDGRYAKRTGTCVHCGKWVPGERTVCGACVAAKPSSDW